MIRKKTSSDPALLDISKQSFVDEKSSIDLLLKKAAIFNKNYNQDFFAAKKMVEDSRAGDGASSVEGFIHQYGLSSAEGVTIMCLAEALLRIPDAETADALIHDKFKDTDWEKYLGKSSSLFVNTSTWGLMLTGNVVKLGDEKKHSAGAIFKRLVNRVGEPIIREALKKAMSIIGTQFVMGENIEKALKKSAPLAKEGFLFSYDMLGEAARSKAQAEKYYQDYIDAINKVAATTDKTEDIFRRTSISVKLSALHPRYELLQEKTVYKELLPRLVDITENAMYKGIAISIDAEETSRLDISLKLFEKLFANKAFKDYDGIGFVLQAYQKRAYIVLDYLLKLAQNHKKRIPIRLVKGAYWDTEIKHAQELGLASYPVFTRKSYTDVSYLVCAAKIFENNDYFYPQFATHNALTIASIMNIAKGRNFEFQRLHGMGKDFYSQILDDVPCRIYAPVGRQADLLAYLIRRLLENGANNSFVNIISDEEKPMQDLLANPIAKAKKKKGTGAHEIPLPGELFKERKNSQGYDLGNYAHRTLLRRKISAFKDRVWQATPIIEGEEQSGKRRNLFTPFDNKRQIGQITNATEKHIDKALDAAEKAFAGWSGTGVENRAKILEKAADLLEEKNGEAIALCIYEAGKTVENAIAEVREAVDFCRYYASHARQLFVGKRMPGSTGEENTLSLSGRGVFACISPWNFPLAIFTGQVTAALAAGNSVIAKPAETTSLIAAFMCKILIEAGVPDGVLNLLPGPGKKIGPKLLNDKRVAGVVFTGSVETANYINLTLARRGGAIIPLIAETGGQNAMIVDSTALPEQVVDDVIKSAFDSAGQRCSALRVLYLQEDIADKIEEMLAGAIEELKIGNPAIFANDIGPVINKAALDNLTAHIRQMKRKYNFIATTPLDKAKAEKGYFIAPHIFAIPHINALKKEVFGPILHIIRFKNNELDKVIDEINSTGYGLTFGIHSRIEERAEYIKSRINAGNIYVNRNMIGAVVGVQPFGGEGLSGTGPKAGGPFYLPRFTKEKTYTVNTAAMGGNIGLLS